MSQCGLWTKICVKKQLNMNSNYAQFLGDFMCQKWRGYGYSDSYAKGFFMLYEQAGFTESV